jgi:thioredoxin reductase (NADPH)
MQEAKDITIIGAGPTGLFAAFYAGMRGASHRLIDNLDQVGGQLTALYPEKYIFDVAGFPQILAKDLVKGLAEQGLRWNPPVHLAEKVIGLKRADENGKPQFTIVTDKDEYPGRTVLIAGGIGAFTPRKLPLKDVDQWNDKGLRVLNPKTFAEQADPDRRRRRLGVRLGGESHVASRFCDSPAATASRGTPSGYRSNSLAAPGRCSCARSQVKAIEGGKQIERVTIFNNKTKEEETVPWTA